MIKQQHFASAKFLSVQTRCALLIGEQIAALDHADTFG